MCGHSSNESFNFCPACGNRYDEQHAKRDGLSENDGLNRRRQASAEWKPISAVKISINEGAKRETHFRGFDGGKAFRKNDALSFACRMFSTSVKAQEREKPDGNILISPYSALRSIGLLVAGARSTTLRQLCKASGFSKKGLLRWCAEANKPELSKSLSSPLCSADSIWLRDASWLKVQHEYADLVGREFAADFFKVPFGDAAVADINSWVSYKTYGMIGNLLEKGSLSDSKAAIVLVNALAFDAAWQCPFSKANTRYGIFKRDDGMPETVQFMTSFESSYLENERCIGFSKPYADSRYEFIALLPKAGLSAKKLASNLSAIELSSLCEDFNGYEAHVEFPKFKADFKIDLGSVFESLGITDVFDARRADLTGIAEIAIPNFLLYASQVVHATAFDLNEDRTRAAAATAVHLGIVSASRPSPVKVKNIIFDRPFVYLVNDIVLDMPLFMGICASVNNS